MDQTAARVGIYARISEDRDGQQTATSRQLEDCRGLAERRSWIVVEQFEDVDISAYDRRAHRPEFERLLTALRDGELDGVVVWKLDRLTRQQRDLVRVMEACEVHKAFVASVMEPIDTRETYGQFVAELLVAQARMESANSSARQKRKAAEQAKLGLPSTGGTRAFGYNMQRSEINEVEAALIREAAEQIQAGQSMRGLCIEWEKRGVVAPSGMPWKQTPLKRLMLSAVLSGQREHGGLLTPGQWPAIITPETTTRLRTILWSPTRRTSPGSARRYLLSGMLRCGRCGERLLARPRNDKTPRYVCAKQVGRPSCGQLAILAEPLDALVFEMVLAALDDDALMAALHSEDRAEDDIGLQIRGDEEALEALATDYYSERLISREEFLSARQAITGRLEANRMKLARRTGTNAVQGLVGSGDVLRAQWPSFALDRKRAVIAAVIDHVVIGPGVKGRRGFEPRRATPVWRY